MKTIKLNDTSQWIGKVDDRDVPFHRLMLTKGTTYNSYLIQAEKPTIIDTVDFSFAQEYVKNLSTIIDPLTIKYVVINHTEPDHSGGLRALLLKAKNAIVVCSKHAVYELQEMYKLYDREFLVVQTGDSLDLGNKTLQFFETPYLHTEETMITYCVEDKILYSCDIFSTHIANETYFDDEETNDILEDFKVYYQLIMHPHRLYVQDMITIVKDLDIDIIAPSHGYILRSHVNDYIGIYDDMSRNTKSNKKGLTLFSSMTKNTKKISEEIQTIYSDHHVDMDIIDIKRMDLPEIKKAIEAADIIFFGTSTRYGDMVGDLEDILKELESMDLSNKIGAAFGSYGWSGESIEIVQDYLQASNINTLNTSDIIKGTGMTDVLYPIRIRFSINDKNIDILKRAIYYSLELITA